jgi:hypothetical protein
MNKALPGTTISIVLFLSSCNKKPVSVRIDYPKPDTATPAGDYFGIKISGALC